MKKLLIKLMAFALTIACLLGAVACTPTLPPDDGGGSEGGPEMALSLVKDGKSEYKILISDQASLVEINASGELQKYIKKLSGVSLPIVYDNKSNLSVYEKYISIGENDLKVKANIDNKNLNLDGYVLQSVANTLFIVGENGAGTLFGVYGFLDEYCGIKFLTADYEYIPEKATLEFEEEISDIEIPAISNRCMFADNTEKSKVFNAKLRTKANRLGDCVELGGKYGDTHKLGVHSLSTFIGPREYYDAHPEWWGYKQDEEERNTPCFTNGLNLTTGRLKAKTKPEGELEYYLEAVIEKFKTLILKTENPIEYYILGQPDGQKLCTCQTCLDHLEKPEYGIQGSRTAQFMIWANAVAWEIQDWIDNNYETEPRLKVNGVKKQVNFLRDAYQWSVAAPVKEDDNGNWVPLTELCRPRSNMGVYFIPITGCFVHGLLDDECSVNTSTVGLYFKQWKSICSLFGVFTYNTDYSNFLSYFPCMSAFSDDLRAYVDAGVTGYILEGALNGGGTYYQQDMMSWAMSKMMWNPDLNLMDLMSEFNSYYFGEEAGKIVDQMVVYMQAHSEIYAAERDQHLSVYGGFNSVNVLTERYVNTLYTYIEKIKAIYDKANLTADEKEEYLLHLDGVSVQVDHMKYKNYDETFASTSQEKYRFMTEFFDKCERVGVGSLKEGGTKIPTLRQQLGF